MRKINCIIVDDEPLAREGLAGYVRQLDFLDLNGLCKNALEATALLHRHPVDLMFLDIEMPLLNGISFLQSLPRSPWVIFTTAYAGYALEGYRFNTVDYLVKPISFERFLQAVNKALRMVEPIQYADKQATVQSPPDEILFIKVDKQLVRLRISDIHYIEGMQNYVAVFTGKERFVTMSSMKSILEVLPSEEFIQVHKSYIVAKSKVESIDESEVVTGPYRVPVSRRLREEVMRSLTGNRILKK